jgi:hypothetical protein
VRLYGWFHDANRIFLMMEFAGEPSLNPGLVPSPAGPVKGVRASAKDDTPELIRTGHGEVFKHLRKARRFSEKRSSKVGSTRFIGSYCRSVDLPIPPSSIHITGRWREGLQSLWEKMIGL